MLLHKIFVNKIFNLSLIFIFGFIFSIIIYPHKKYDSKVLSETLTQNDNITIFVTAHTSAINYKIFPEKRFPIVNNWQNTYKIAIQNCVNNDIIFSTDSLSNNLGKGTISINPSTISNGNYRFLFIGTSHLRFKSQCYSLNKIEQSIDFSLKNRPLKAGEISSHFDNYINSLDISHLMLNFGSNEIKSDLNRDSKVNALDLSILINNLFLAGE